MTLINEQKTLIDEGKSLVDDVQTLISDILARIGLVWTRTRKSECPVNGTRSGVVLILGPNAGCSLSSPFTAVAARHFRAILRQSQEPECLIERLDDPIILFD